MFPALFATNPAVREGHVVRTGGLAVLRGNLAPNGAVIKSAGVAAAMLTHTGPAIIFDSQEEAGEGILAGKVKAGDVVVSVGGRPEAQYSLRKTGKKAAITVVAKAELATS